jgi:hypothetical protein
MNSSYDKASAGMTVATALLIFLMKLVVELEALYAGAIKTEDEPVFAMDAKVWTVFSFVIYIFTFFRTMIFKASYVRIRRGGRLSN